MPNTITYDSNLTPDLLMLALYHDHEGLQRLDELLGLDDTRLAALTRRLLEQSVQYSASPEAAELGMSQQEFDDAIQLGIDDMEAGRVLTLDELEQSMKAKYSFL